MRNQIIQHLTLLIHFFLIESQSIFQGIKLSPKLHNLWLDLVDLILVVAWPIWLIILLELIDFNDLINVSLLNLKLVNSFRDFCQRMVEIWFQEFCKKHFVFLHIKRESFAERRFSFLFQWTQMVLFISWVYSKGWFLRFWISFWELVESNSIRKIDTLECNLDLSFYFFLNLL